MHLNELDFSLASKGGNAITIHKRHAACASTGPNKSKTAHNNGSDCVDHKMHVPETENAMDSKPMY